jgi:hypothetical protein
VPDTVAEHWLVWPVWTLVEAQETATDVMVEDMPPPVFVLLLLLQPDANIQADKTQNEPKRRKALDN